MFIKRRKQFIAIDQHAADERIQLEALFDLYDYRKNDNNNNNTNNNTHVGKFTLDTIIQINLSMIDFMVVKEHYNVFKFWKFDFEVVDDNNKDDSTKRFSHNNDNKMKINLIKNLYFNMMNNTIQMNKI